MQTVHGDNVRHAMLHEGGMECGDLSPLSPGDLSPAKAPMPGDKSPGPKSCDQSQHSTTSLPPRSRETDAALECGDLSPLSAGDLSPSNAPTPSDAPPSANACGLADKSAIKQSGDKSPHSTPATPSASPPHSKMPWPHAPVHKLSEHGVYFVTAGTLHKVHVFRDAERLDLLERKLLTLAEHYYWQVEAWAVFPNHYHCVCRGNPDSADLGKLLRHLHADTARELNRLDQTPGRQVWHNFRDTKLTFEHSYLARLNYVHQNAVKHGLVPVANQYRWCSAAWFERVATPAQVQTLYSMKTDQVNVPDDF